mgnify:CR=1 FL=1
MTSDANACKLAWNWSETHLNGRECGTHCLYVGQYTRTDHEREEMHGHQQRGVHSVQDQQGAIDVWIKSYLHHANL